MASNQQQDWQGRMLGRYKLVRMLGKGGMGEVWLAEDTQLRRQVAVKMLPPVHASDDSYLKAFAYEARAAAALEHPHILPVHDYGEEPDANNGIVTFLIMPYMTGGSLRERIRAANGPLPVEEALNYLKQAGQAIDYAHSQQVLHRDIKPANMLLQNNWLFLADFGIAKLLSSSTYRSQTYAGAGTPEYMAPEQAQGHAEAASDRYSLALIAYQMFTGHLPFRGESPYDVLIKQLMEAPASPRQFNPALPPDVEQVLMQGLAKQPGARPPSCASFVDMLERGWQTQRLAQARDEDATVLAPWSRRLRQVQPPPLPFSSTPQPVAQQAPLKLPPITEVPNAPITGGPQFPISGGMPQPQPFNNVPQAPVRPSEPYSPGGPQAPMNMPPHYPVSGGPAPYQQQQASLPGAPGTNPQPMMPPITAPNGNMPGAYNNPYSIYNMSNMAPNTAPPYAVPGGQPGTPGSFGSEVPAAERANKIKRRNLLIGGGAVAAIVIVGGAALAANSLSHIGSKPPAIIPTPTPIPGPQRFMAGVAQLSITGHSKTVSVAAWDPSGRYLATAGQDNLVMVWDLGSYLKNGTTRVQTLSKPLHRWIFPNEIFYQEMSWSHDGQKLIISALGTLYSLDVFGKGNVQPVKYHNANDPDPILGTNYEYPSLAPNSDIFVTAVEDNLQVAFWNLKKTDGPTKTLKYSDPNAPTNGLPMMQETGWSKDGAYVGGLTNYGKVVVWDTKTDKVVTTYDTPDRTNGKGVMVERDAFYWSPADPHILLASDVDVALIYDVRKGKPLFTLGTDDPDALTIPKQGPNDIPFVPNMTGLASSPNGRYVAAGYGRSARVHIWDLQNKTPKVKNGVRIQDLMFPGPNDTVGHNKAITEVTWSPDGRYIATGSFDTTVIIWKVDRM